MSKPLQLPLWAPESSWVPPEISQLPTDWNAAKRVGLDVETNDTHLKELGIGVRRGGYITGASVALEDGPKFYLPIRHEGGGNLPVENVINYLKYQCKNFTGTVVGANFSYDLDYFLEEGIEFPNVEWFRDVQVADPLIYELHMQYSLQAIAQRHGLPGKAEGKLAEAAAAFGVDKKSGMWRLHSKYVGEYAEIDSVLPLDLIRRQERKIDELNLWDIYNLESKVLPVLVNMRRKGVLIDEDKLTQIEEWSIQQEAECLASVHSYTGIKIQLGDVWKAKALAPALEERGVVLPKTSTGAPSIDKELLGSSDDPVFVALAKARKVNKLRTTFAKSVRNHMVNGRIHCTFNQMTRETEGGDQKGARYGRLSATNPNLQQQPSRDEFASTWRSIYIPEHDSSWASCDYSQQEPRWTTHFAALMNLDGARDMAKAYRDDPSLDNHQFMSDLTGLPRTQAKDIYLGLCYGEGGAKLCTDLGLPTQWHVSMGRGKSYRVIYFDTRDEALDVINNDQSSKHMWLGAGEEGRRILGTFDDRAPFIRQLSSAAKSRAEAVGYIITGGGRRLNFKQRDNGTYDFTHKALNRLIQGTSADQTKKALVEIEAQGFKPQLQVHDEIICSVLSRNEANCIAEIMRDVMLDAEVPFKVDIEIGPSWGEAK